MTLGQVRNTKQENPSQILNAQWEGPGNTAVPRQPWAEIGIEEKVERLRTEIQSLYAWKQWASSQILSLEESIARLIGHSHDALGHVVVPFRPQYGAGMAGKSESPFDPLA